jgi:hypothetical protein
MMLLRCHIHPLVLSMCLGLLLQVSRARWALSSSKVLAQLRGELHVWIRPPADLRGLCWPQHAGGQVQAVTARLVSNIVGGIVWLRA